MVLKCCKSNKESVLEQVRAGKIDAITLSSTNLVDDIILAMHTNGVLNCLSQGIKDKRSHNTTVPYNMIWASAIAAKMKVHSSLTDIPYAITDHRVLAELGYSLYDSSGNIGESFMNEGSIRFLVGKYETDDFVTGYNNTVQNYIMPKLDIEPNIHILDCTDLEVNFDNKNYEGSDISYSKRTKDGTLAKGRGYKLATLRGIVDDSGIIEDIRFGSLNTHDLKLSEEMLINSPVLKSGDILINDRGFLSREIINYLKKERNIDTYVPLKKNMVSFQIAVQAAKDQNKWSENPKYKRQWIALVTGLGEYWPFEEKIPDSANVPINGCVIWYEDTDSYAVIATTDLTQSAKNIINTYHLRPEIEEDYRQIKDFWKIEDFKSTKLNLIVFHVVCVLFGYLFFQLYTMLPDGEQYAGKSLPVLLKKYQAKVQGHIVIYVDDEFGVFSLFEVMELYAHVSGEAKSALEKEIKKWGNLHEKGENIICLFAFGFYSICLF